MAECYASCCGDCSGKISREHYISRGLLNMSKDDEGLVSLGGQLRRVERTSVKNTAVANILCEHHNSRLSSLDAEVEKLVSSIYEFNSDPKNMTIQVDAQALTHWFFKLILGIYISQKKHEYIGNKELVNSLVQVLFSQEKLPGQFGFSISNPPTPIPDIIIGDDGIPPWCFQLFEVSSRISGLEFWAYPFAHRLHFAGPDYSEESVFRPSGTGFSFSDDISLHIEYLW